MTKQSSPDIAQQLLDRVERHDKMTMGNDHALGYFSTWDAKLLREAAAALRASLQPATIDDDCACGGGDISGHDTMCPWADPFRPPPFDPAADIAKGGTGVPPTEDK